MLSNPRCHLNYRLRGHFSAPKSARSLTRCPRRAYGRCMPGVRVAARKCSFGRGAARSFHLPPLAFPAVPPYFFSVTAFELYLSYHPRRRLSSRRRARPRAQSAFRDRIAVLYNKTTWKSRCHSPIIKMYETIFYSDLSADRGSPTPRF